MNLVSCYCVALPLAFLGGFYLNMSVEGLLAGICCGPVLQAFILSVLAFSLDWKQLAVAASLDAGKEHAREVLPAERTAEEVGLL